MQCDQILRRLKFIEKLRKISEYSSLGFIRVKYFLYEHTSAIPKAEILVNA